jgi:hypothetical protein
MYFYICFTDFASSRSFVVKPDQHLVTCLPTETCEDFVLGMRQMLSYKHITTRRRNTTTTFLPVQVAATLIQKQTDQRLASSS